MAVKIGRRSTSLRILFPHAPSDREPEMSLPLVFNATSNAPWNFMRPLRSRKFGFKSSDGYTAFRIGAPRTAQIGPCRPKDASNLSTRRSQRLGSHSLCTSIRILWHERGAHGQRGVTAGVEKDMESSSSPEKQKRQIRPEVHGRPTPQGPYNNVLLQRKTFLFRTLH
ncbi:hypothetical protein Mapa_014700 [Marchantia paleacea]|nr:hypothetical protein Mapa_014700 [Marchantia paleacea]